MRTIITFGTFDLLHIGHINILKRAKAEGTRLVVGIPSDYLVSVKKGKKPIINQDNRLEIIQSLACVDECFLQEHNIEDDREAQRGYIKKYHADALVMGHDWTNKFDFCKDICEVIYLERTKDISSSLVKSFIVEKYKDDFAIFETETVE